MIPKNRFQRRVERDSWSFQIFPFYIDVFYTHVMHYFNLSEKAKSLFCWGVPTIHFGVPNSSCRNCMTILLSVVVEKYNTALFPIFFPCSGWSFSWSGQTSSQRRFSEPIYIHKIYIGPNCCEIHLLGSIPHEPWAQCKVHLVCEPLRKNLLFDIWYNMILQRLFLKHEVRGPLNSRSVESLSHHPVHCLKSLYIPNLEIQIQWHFVACRVQTQESMKQKKQVGLQKDVPGSWPKG